MKSEGHPLLCGKQHPEIPRIFFRTVRWFFGATTLLLGACSPAPEPPPSPTPEPETTHTSLPATRVVPIPEEFTAPPPTPEPPVAVLPRVVFATSDFQVTTAHGIQGISTGEAMDFVREDNGDYVVRYGTIEFKKHSSFFAATYVKPVSPPPSPAPDTIDAPAIPTQPTGSPDSTASHPPADPPSEMTAAANEPPGPENSQEPPLPGEPPLSGTIPPPNDPLLQAEQKKVAEITGSIRNLNDQIRSAQDALDRNTSKLSKQELKKESRAIQRLKEKRDALSGELTELGKP